MAAPDQILLGSITITMSVETHFGFFTGISISNGAGLGTRFTSDGSDNRKLFGVIKAGGPGTLTLKGILASTLPGEDTFCSALSSLVEDKLTGTVHSSVTLGISFGFNDSDDVSVTLNDVMIQAISAQTQGMLMSGEVSFSYVSAE